jgi:pimeloyl-ACP methyl ester carboxylesterase
MREKLYQTSYALDDIRRIRFPVLLIVGADDQTFPPAAIHSVAAKIRGATVVVLPDAGHSPYFETPDAWNEVVMNFLGSVTQP